MKDQGRATKFWRWKVHPVMANNRTKKRKKQSVWSDIGEKFTFSYWRHNYLSAALLIVACVFIYRGTTDGLWFILTVFVLLAWRFELCVRTGLPFTYWKEREGTLREIGFFRAFTSVIFWPITKRQYENNSILRLLCFVVPIIFILHIYIVVIIIFHSVDPQRADFIFTEINDHFNFIFKDWPSYIRVEEGLIAHGYEDRIPIIKNAYLSSIVGSIFLYIFLALDLFKVKYFNTDILRSTVEYFKGPIKNPNNNKIVWFLNKAYYFVVSLAGIFLLLLFVYHYTSMPILYPGESLPWHGRGLWMASYGYKDNLALFYTSYIVVVPLWFVAGAIISTSIVIFFTCKRGAEWIMKKMIK